MREQTRTARLLLARGAHWLGGRMRAWRNAGAEPPLAEPPLYMRADALELLDRMEAPAEVREYAAQVVRDGYTVIRDDAMAPLCDRALARFHAFEDANRAIFARHRDEDGHYPRIVNLHLVLGDLLELFVRNRLALQVQDLLFGSETSVYTSLFFERGSAQPFHRDTPYFCTRPEYRYFGMWVALEDVDDANGPLSVIEGGHRIPEFDRAAIAHQFYASLEDVPSDAPQLWDAYQQRVEQECDRRCLRRLTLPVRKGETVIWHPQLPHGGAPIVDRRRTRYSLVMHTTPVGTPVYHQNVFFNPARPVPGMAPWRYARYEDRRYAVVGQEVSFGHAVSYPLSDFAPVPSAA